MRNGFEEVLERTPQVIQAPDDECVTGTEMLERLALFGARTNRILS